MKKILLVALAASAFAAPANARVFLGAEEERFPVLADTFLDASQPDRGYVRRSFRRTNDTPSKVMLMRFSPEAVASSGAVPVWHTAICLEGASVGDELDIFEVSGAWNGATTWSTRPALGKEIWWQRQSFARQLDRSGSLCITIHRLTSESVALFAHYTGKLSGSRAGRYHAGRAFVKTSEG